MYMEILNENLNTYQVLDHILMAYLQLYHKRFYQK